MAFGRERRSGGTRRLGFAAAVLGTAALAIALISFSPWSDSGKDDGPLGLARFDAATAAEVLGLTADAARDEQSLVPGPNQVLYFRLAQTPTSASGDERVTIEEWIDPEGRGVRLDGASGGSSTGTNGGGIETSPARSEFDAGRAVDRNLMVTDLPLLVEDRVVQGVDADVPPAAVEAVVAVGRPRPLELEYPGCRLEHHLVCHDLRRVNGHRDLAALALGPRLAECQPGLDQLVRPVDQSLGGMQACLELAESLEDGGSSEA